MSTQPSITSSFPPPPALASRLTTALACAAVVGLGAYFRLIHLGVPTLWFDEMFSALMASHSLRYITDFALKLGLHPPYFYYFLKFVSQAGISDFALRISFALAGTATVYLIYRFTRDFFSESAALFAGLFIAINPLHIWLSRQIRPYALLIFFFLLSAFFLARFLRDGQGKSLVKLVLANTALLSLHFLCFPLVATEVLIVLANAARTRTQEYWNKCLLLCLGTAVTALPSLFFLANLLMMGNGYTSSSSATYTEMSRNIVGCVNEVIFLGGLFPYARPIILMAALAGLARLLYFRPKTFLFLTAISLGPLVMFLALRFGSGIMPAYVSFLLIPLACIIGFVFETKPRFLPLTNAATLVAALFSLVALHADYARLFETEKAVYASSIFNVGRFKTIAKTLPEALSQGDLVIMSDQAFAEAVNWYLDQSLADNPISNQRLSPEGQEAFFDYVGFKNNFSHFAKDRAGLFDLLGQPVSVSAADEASVYRFRVARHPAETLDALPRAIRFTALPQDVYAKAFSLSNLSINPFWGYSLIPSKARTPGKIEFAFNNETGSHVHSIWLWFAYSNAGSKNALEASVTFDGEPAELVYSSKGVDGLGRAVVKVERDTPYEQLRIGFTLTAERNTPTPLLGDLEKLELKKASVYICDRDDESQCLTRLYVDVLPQGLLAESTVVQKTTSRENVKNEEDDQKDWSRYTPADPTRNGIILFEANTNRDEFIFYSRVCGKNSIVNIFEKSGTTRTLLFSLGGLENECTPIGLQTIFRAIAPHKDSARTFEVELQNAELWHKGEKILF